METTHENSRFRSQLLEKTRVLNPALLARLKSQFLPSATATVAADSGISLTHVKTEGVIPPSPPKIQEVDYFLNQLKIQPIDTQSLITSQNSNSDFLTELNKISYLPSISEIFSLISNSDFVQELNKISCLTPLNLCERDYLVTEPKIQLSDVGKSHLTNNSKSEESSQLEKINQLSFFDGFNCLDLVAVTGNNQILSKSTSVTTPQRHCGFFAPVIYSASQAIKCSAKMTTAHLRPKSVYDWMTRPNKPMANKSGGSSRPRVNPVALISQFSVTSHNSKLLGVAHHG